MPKGGKRTGSGRKPGLPGKKFEKKKLKPAAARKQHRFPPLYADENERGIIRAAMQMQGAKNFSKWAISVLMREAHQHGHGNDTTRWSADAGTYRIILV